ncbi:hypothetical protein M569_02693, partial [Genlisea aurea]
SVFANSEPIREEQVENAVKFLSHPKVRGSPVIYRRSFLERKGLTKEEIDEAFRRVPDPSPAITASQPADTSQDGQNIPSSNAQYQQPIQVLHPTAVGNLGILSRFHWYHAILGIGFLAASGAGTAVFLKKSIIPRLKSWIRNVVLEKEGGENESSVKQPNIAEETAAAAKAAAAAAADVALASREMLASQSEEKRCLEKIVDMLNVQVLEMKAMNNAIHKLENGIKRIPWMPAILLQVRSSSLVTTSSPLHLRLVVPFFFVVARSVSSPAPHHPKSYMEILDMVSRGEKPSNIREIDDAPPNPNQPVSNPRVAPRPKPWEEVEDIVDGDDSSSAVPYWRRRNVRISEIEDGGDEVPKFDTSERRSSWVPPQPPPVMMAEAAAAIRQPKKPASSMNSSAATD